MFQNMKERKQIEIKFGKTDWSLMSVLKNKSQTLPLVMIKQTQTLFTNLQVLSEELPYALHMPRHTPPFLKALAVPGISDCGEVTTACVVSKALPFAASSTPITLNAWAEFQ